MGKSNSGKSYAISTHTPTQGVTLSYYEVLCKLRISTHTPTQGVTPGQEPVRRNGKISTHTPTQGVTYEPLTIVTYLGFQPTLPRRE